MVTRKQLEDALKVIAEYERQVLREHEGKNLEAHQVGCRVKLSDYGREVQRAHGMHGTVIDYVPWIVNPTKDGIVTVKWDGRKRPVDMHIHHVTPIKHNDPAKGKASPTR